jgi:predicted phage gp36 major capsid-like protein
MDDILQEIEDIRMLLSTTKSENLRESLQKRLEEIEKNLEDLRKEEERRPFEQSEKKKEVIKKIKLHSFRKFKID